MSQVYALDALPCAQFIPKRDKTSQSKDKNFVLLLLHRWPDCMDKYMVIKTDWEAPQSLPNRLAKCGIPCSLGMNMLSPLAQKWALQRKNSKKIVFVWIFDLENTISSPLLWAFCSLMNAGAFFPICIHSARSVTLMLSDSSDINFFLLWKEVFSFASFPTLPWSIFVCWFTSLLIFSSIPDKAFLELTTSFQEKRTQLWMRSQKYQEEGQ